MVHVSRVVPFIYATNKRLEFLLYTFILFTRSLNFLFLFLAILNIFYNPTEIGLTLTSLYHKFLNFSAKLFQLSTHQHCPHYIIDIKIIIIKKYKAKLVSLFSSEFIYITILRGNFDLQRYSMKGLAKIVQGPLQRHRAKHLHLVTAHGILACPVPEQPQPKLLPLKVLLLQEYQHLMDATLFIAETSKLY